MKDNNYTPGYLPRILEAEWVVQAATPALLYDNDYRELGDTEYHVFAVVPQPDGRVLEEFVLDCGLNHGIATLVVDQHNACRAFNLRQVRFWDPARIPPSPNQCRDWGVPPPPNPGCPSTDGPTSREGKF